MKQIAMRMRSFWLVLVGAMLIGIVVAGVQPVLAVSEAQESAVKNNCDSIKEVLRNVQKDDSRARVHLGAYYEAVLSKFITPLNVRLVENNLSTASLVENQNKFADARDLFATDFVNYQQGLEELVLMDCHNDSKEFYEKLEKVRQKRKIVEQDTVKLRGLITEHIKSVTGLEGKV